MNLRDLHSGPDLLLLQEAEEDRADQVERDRRHGPVVGEDPCVEAELVSPVIRRRYIESGAFA